MTDDDIRSAPRVCFFAHYHPHGIAAPHVLIYLEALRAAGFAVVILSTATMEPAERDKLAAACAVLVLRENHGLDFGGWIEAVARFFPLSAEFLLFANDSVYAPFGDLLAFIARLTAVPADFYGAVQSYEAGDHLQSWFLLLRPAAYRSSAFLHLMGAPIPPGMSKQDIIMTYEVGLTAALVGQGLRFHAAYSPKRSGRIAQERPFNPTHLLWRQLIERDRIPFLKIELLRDDPARIADLEDWHAVATRLAPDLAAAVVQDVARRRTFAGHDRGERWNWSLYVDRAVYWPETRGFMLRDHALRGPLARRLNRYGFLLIERLGGAIRRRLRDRAGDGATRQSSV